MAREYKAINRQSGKTPLRAIRVQSDLWDAAKKKASENGETITEVVRKALAEYIGAE